MNASFRAVPLFAFLAFLALVAPAHAQLGVGSSGADGALVVANGPDEWDATIDLGNPTASWDPNGHQPPGANTTNGGVYDSGNWAVVFNYTSVDIQAGARVRFINHPERAPVVWLVQGDVTIAGEVNLDGKNGVSTPQTYAEPGPGGFRGGVGFLTGVQHSAGFGPGGGPYVPAGIWGAGGSHATAGSNNPAPLYGNPSCLPLIGGSGGSGRNDVENRQGGAGGGAILIATDTAINLDGGIYCRGGATGFAVAASGAGAGGAIRLVADSLTGNGVLVATGGYDQYNPGGHGRVRIEINSQAFTGYSAPVWSIDTPQAPPKLFLSPSDRSTRILSVGGTNAPSGPTGAFDFPNEDVKLGDVDQAAVVVETINVPTDWLVSVRVTPKNGPDVRYTATLIGGNATLATWSVDVNLSDGYSVIQVLAEAPGS